MTWARQLTSEQRRAETLERRQKPVQPSAVKPLAVGRYGGEVRPMAAKSLPKLTRRQKVRHDIRDSARGEACLVRLPCVCTHDPEKTIWSHYRGLDAAKGLGTKSVDLAGAYCCTACDAVYDGQARSTLSRETIEAAWAVGHFRSLVRLAEKGLV